MKDGKKAGDIAVQRFQLLSPLLADGLDPAKLRELKAQICEQTGICERTLRRHLAALRREGFEGLKPRGKSRSVVAAAIPQELLNAAIQLRREVATRSLLDPDSIEFIQASIPHRLPSHDSRMAPRQCWAFREQTKPYTLK